MLADGEVPRYMPNWWNPYAHNVGQKDPMTRTRTIIIIKLVAIGITFFGGAIMAICINIIVWNERVYAGLEPIKYYNNRELINNAPNILKNDDSEEPDKTIVLDPKKILETKNSFKIFNRHLIARSTPDINENRVGAQDHFISDRSIIDEGHKDILVVDTEIKAEEETNIKNADQPERHPRFQTQNRVETETTHSSLGELTN